MSHVWPKISLPSSGMNWLTKVTLRRGEMDDGFPEVKLHQCKGLCMTQRLHHSVLPSSLTLKQMFCRRMYNVSEFLIFFNPESCRQVISVAVEAIFQIGHNYLIYFTS